MHEDSDEDQMALYFLPNGIADEVISRPSPKQPSNNGFIGQQRREEPNSPSSLLSALGGTIHDPQNRYVPPPRPAIGSIGYGAATRGPPPGISQPLYRQSPVSRIGPVQQQHQWPPPVYRTRSQSANQPPMRQQQRVYQRPVVPSPVVAAKKPVVAESERRKARKLKTMTDEDGFIQVKRSSGKSSQMQQRKQAISFDTSELEKEKPQQKVKPKPVIKKSAAAAAPEKQPQQQQQPKKKKESRRKKDDVKKTKSKKEPKAEKQQQQQQPIIQQVSPEQPGLTSHMSKLVISWIVGLLAYLSAGCDAVVYTVIQVHEYALRSLTKKRHHVVFSFSFLYAFPYLVHYVIPWAPPWAPVCLWYAFLLQLFCTHGSSPMVGTFRIILPLFFLIEGVSHHSFLLELNGAELLLISFILCALKTRNISSPFFFLSVAAQCLSAVFLGSQLIVQWMQFILALCSLQSLTLAEEKENEWDLDPMSPSADPIPTSPGLVPSRKTKSMDRRLVARSHSRKR